jgi:putative FmdB family regulatory protein
MPFYEYECANCKFYTEVMQKITDRPLKKCPSCGRNTLRKLVSAPNFRLKGGGWYETDFKSDKETRRNLAEAEKSEAKEASPADAEKKTESKPAGETKAAPVEASKPRPKVARTRAKTATPQRAAKAKGARPGSSARSRSARKARR